MTAEQYELTASGRDLRGAVSVEVQAIRGLLSQGLTDDDYEHTIATLQLMVRNLEAPS